MPDIKDAIAGNFSAAAACYDEYAVMQQQAAMSLVRQLSDLRPQVPPGPVLEVGCGTGAVSKELAAMFSDRRLTLIDLAPGMIDKNRQALTPLLAPSHQVEWQVRDAEAIDIDRHYALIASCLTLQWFQDLPRSLSGLCAALIPGGFLLCSYLSDKSFPEWRQACQSIHLPCTMNPLPNGDTILNMVHGLGYEASAWSETIQMPYSTVLDFFKSLKRTGTDTSAAHDKLSRIQMAQLLSTWQNQAKGAVTVTYQINTLLVQA